MYRILIVDDESIEREALKYIIEKSNLPIEAIEEAVNGQDAISVAAVFKPDIVFMDIKMPGLNGIESSKIIKKIKEDTKIIFQTAFDEFKHAQEGIRLGVEAFIVKPAANERIIDVLTKTIHILDQEKRDKESQLMVEDKLKQFSKYLESEFLTSVIHGDLNEVQLKEYLTFMNIQGTIGFGSVVLLHFNATEQLSDLRKQMIKKRIIELMKMELSKHNGGGLVTYIKDTVYVLILRDSEDEVFMEQDWLKGLLMALGEEVSESLGVNIDIGIGDVKEHIQDMWQSFSVAKSACRKKVYEHQSDPQIERLPLLVRSIVECDEALINDRVDLIFESLISETKDLDVFKVKLYEFIVLLKQSVLDEVPITLEPSELVFGKIMGIKTIGGSKVVLKDYVHQMYSEVAAQKSDKTMVIMDKLITYINNHYNENISLEHLGEISGFSPCYLSKVFKKHVDMNFSDYLAMVRIRVAKRQLKNPNKSVKEISLEVGYVDPNYFARVFRKQENMTPTDFRNRYMQL